MELIRDMQKTASLSDINEAHKHLISRTFKTKEEAEAYKEEHRYKQLKITRILDYQHPDIVVIWHRWKEVVPVTKNGVTTNEVKSFKRYIATIKRKGAIPYTKAYFVHPIH